jgi:Zn-dependent peptidase ImmA (M78 family)
MVNNAYIKLISIPKVKFLKTEEIEAEAENLLKEYYEIIKPTNIIPINMDLIIEKVLNLNLHIDNLQRFYDIKDVIGTLSIESRQIMIDESLCSIEGRFNFTCAHELGHWQLHRQYLINKQNQLALFTPRRKTSIVCRSSCKKEPIEWQADYFAGAVLMPRETFVNVFAELLSRFRIDIKKPGYTEKLRKHQTLLKVVIQKLSGRFKVSKEATRVRLNILGLLPDENVSLFF